MERGNGILRYHYADATRADDAWSCIRRRFYALQTAEAAHAPKPGNRAISMPRRPRRARSAPVRPFQAKRVIYVDSETWFAPYVDTYSRDGQLFQECPLLAGLSRPGGPGSARRHLSFPAVNSWSAQRVRPANGFATMCYLPGIETPERECWYVNMGTVTRDFFTTRAMSNAAPQSLWSESAFQVLEAVCPRRLRSHAQHVAVLRSKRQPTNAISARLSHNAVSLPGWATSGPYLPLQGPTRTVGWQNLCHQAWLTP